MLALAQCTMGLLISYYDSSFLCRYFRIKYEDLLLEPNSTLVALLTQLRLKFNIDTILDHLYQHTHPKISKKKKKKYQFQFDNKYSTYRNATNNDIYKWKTELPKTRIKMIEHSCSDFLKSAGYSTNKTEEKK